MRPGCGGGSAKRGAPPGRRRAWNSSDDRHDTSCRPAAADRCRCGHRHRQRGAAGCHPNRAVAGSAAAGGRPAGPRRDDSRRPAAGRRRSVVDGRRRAGRPGHPGPHRLAAAARRPLLPQPAGATGGGLAGRPRRAWRAGGQRTGHGLGRRGQQRLLRRCHPADVCCGRPPTPGQRPQRSGGAAAGRAGRASRLPGGGAAAAGGAHRPAVDRRRHRGGHLGCRARLLPAAGQQRQPGLPLCGLSGGVGAALPGHLDRAVLRLGPAAAADHGGQVGVQRRHRARRGPGRSRMNSPHQGHGDGSSMTIVTARAGRREWAGLAVLALPCLLYAMDLTVLNLAVPHLSADLEPSSAQLLWIVDIYGFMVAGSLITMGTLGDRIGRRRLLLAGAAAFGAASRLAAWSSSAEMLIGARALLGIAGATVAPTTLSLIRNMFADPRQRTVAISVWITSFSIGGAIGPLLGGALLEWFWWGSVFLLAVPVMALLLLLGPILLPEFRDPDAGRLDLVSAALSVAAVLAVIYGLKQLAQDGLGWLPALSIPVGLAIGVVFVRRQQTLADPLLDLRLFRVPAFSAALTTNLLSFFVGFGTLLFIAQYLQLVLGLSPLAAGLWMLPASGGFIVGSVLTPVLAGRVRPGLLMAGGLGLAAVGFGLLTQLGSDHTGGLAVLVTGSVVFSLGLAPVDTLATDLAIGAASAERAGAASALAETSA